MVIGETSGSGELFILGREEDALLQVKTDKKYSARTLVFPTASVMVVS